MFLNPIVQLLLFYLYMSVIPIKYIYTKVKFGVSEQFSAISWQEQVILRWDDDDVYFVQDQHNVLDFYSVSSLKQQSVSRHVTPHYLESEPTCLCSYCSILCAQRRTSKYQCYSFCSDLSAISWRPVLVVEEAGVPGENHRPWASNW